MLNRMKSASASIIAIAAMIALAPSLSHSEPTEGQKAQDAADKSVKGTRKAVRSASDKLCTGTDAECAGRKAKHELQNAGDDVDTKAKELHRKGE